MVEIANDRKVIVILPLDESFYRLKQGIQKYAPDALVYLEGNIEELIANCEILITNRLSEIYVALAFGKAVYANVDLDLLKKMIPLQHGQAARNIANVCRTILETSNFTGERNPGKIVRLIPQYVA